MDQAEIDRRRAAARLRKQRQRERDAAALLDRLAATHVTVNVTPAHEVSVTPEPVTLDVTPESSSNALLIPEPKPVVTAEPVTPPVPVTPDVTCVTPVVRLVSAPAGSGSWPLVALAFGALAVGLVNNISFALSQGDTPQTQAVFAAMTVVNDGAAFFLLDQTKRLWSGRSYIRSVVALGLFVFTLGFALDSSLGFASLSIANVTTARAERQSPGLTLAQRNLDTLTRSRTDECKRRGPLCRELESKEQSAVAAVQAEQSRISTGANPQIAEAAKLVTWWSVGHLTPTSGDFSMLWLTFLTVLPQLGGLLLMIARR